MGRGSPFPEPFQDERTRRPANGSTSKMSLTNVAVQLSVRGPSRHAPVTDVALSLSPQNATAAGVRCA